MKCDKLKYERLGDANKTKKGDNMIKDLVIFICLLLIGVAGCIVIFTVPMPHAIGAVIGIFSSVFVIAGGVGLWEIVDAPSRDDDDGPHFYGPGGTVI